MNGRETRDMNRKRTEVEPVELGSVRVASEILPPHFERLTRTHLRKMKKS